MPHDPHERSAAWRYGLAILAVTVAVLVTKAAQQFGLQNRSAAFLAAVLLTGWYAGTGPLLLSVVLSALVFDFFFLPPLYTLGPQLSSDPYLAWFLIFALLAAWFSTARRRSAALLEQARHDLEHRVATRTEELHHHARLLDLSHDTVFVRDMNDSITYWNRGAELLYGWSRSEAIGQTSHQLTHTIFPAPLEEINDTLLRTGRWEGELVHAKRDGTRVVVASRWSLQRDQQGRPAAILETNNDVTARKQAEDVMRERAQLLDLTHDTVFVRDMHDVITYWNRGAEGLYGWTGEEAVGQITHQLLHTLFPAPLDEINEELFAAGYWEGELVHTRRDGSQVVVASRWSLQRDAQGQPSVILETNNDITTQKRAQRALRRARQDALEAQFGAVLEERTRIAREMHDTLLQGFTGIGLKLVAAANKVSGPPETTAALREVIAEAQTTLTEARRAVWGLRAVTLTGNDFSAGLRAAAEDCVRGTTLELEFDVRGLPRPVDPDVEAVVVRVAQEAITNVVKHAEARTVRVRLSFGARRARLSVRDDGRGFLVAPDFHAYAGHWGLLGMRERAGQVRGKFAVRSVAEHGTTVVLLVPYTITTPQKPE